MPYTLSERFSDAMENLLDELYTIERDRGIEHSIFYAEVATYFGYDVADEYDAYFEENE